MASLASMLICTAALDVSSEAAAISDWAFSRLALAAWQRTFGFLTGGPVLGCHKTTKHLYFVHLADGFIQNDVYEVYLSDEGEIIYHWLYSKDVQHTIHPCQSIALKSLGHGSYCIRTPSQLQRKQAGTGITKSTGACVTAERLSSLKASFVTEIIRKAKCRDSLWKIMFLSTNGFSKKDNASIAGQSLK